MTDLSSDDGPNAAQIAYWRTAGGRAWVEDQAVMDRLLSEVEALLVDRAAPTPGARVLDVGCGAGTTSFDLATRVGPEGAVLGVDVSADLLALAEARRGALGLGQTRFAEGDAQTVAFEPEGFDLVASRFGVLFFDDPTAAFANLARALRPGGRLCFAAWAPIEENPWFREARDAAAAVLGPVAQAPLWAPGPFALADAARTVGLLEAAGFAGAQVETTSPRLWIDGDAPAAAALATRIGPVARALKELEGGPAEAEAIADRLTGVWAAFDRGGAIAVPAQVHLVSAHRAD